MSSAMQIFINASSLGPHGPQINRRRDEFVETGELALEFTDTHQSSYATNCCFQCYYCACTKPSRQVMRVGRVRPLQPSLNLSYPLAFLYLAINLFPVTSYQSDVDNSMLVCSHIKVTILDTVQSINLAFTF